MSKKDHKVELWSSKGKTERWCDADEAKELGELPFKNRNYSHAKITEPDYDGSTKRKK